MPEIDDFLASLDDDESQEQEKPEFDAKKLGYALRQEQKQKKAMAKELEELKAFQADIVAKERASTLKAAGLTDGQAKAFQAMYPEISDEAIAAFKTEVLGLTETPAEEAPAPETETPVVNVPGFGPTQVRSGETPGPRMYNADELAEIWAVDPERANKIVAEGHFKRNEWADLYKKPEKE